MSKHYCRDCKEHTEWVESKALAFAEYPRHGKCHAPQPSRSLQLAVKCKKCGRSVQFASKSEVRRWQFQTGRKLS